MTCSCRACDAELDTMVALLVFAGGVRDESPARALGSVHRARASRVSRCRISGTVTRTSAAGWTELDERRGSPWSVDRDFHLIRGSHCWRTAARSVRSVSSDQRMLTARAAMRATVVSDISAWSIISTFAHRDSTGTSVGEKAVLAVKATNR